VRANINQRGKKRNYKAMTLPRKHIHEEDMKNYHTIALRMLEKQRAEIQKGIDSGTITGEQHHKRFVKKRGAILRFRPIK